MVPTSVTRRRRRPTRYASLAFPDDLRLELEAELVEAHAAQPFRLRDPRDAARRVDRLLRARGLETVFVRGALDIGGAELDHVWTVADGRVVDVVVPVGDVDFLRTLRGYVAGDVDPDVIDAEAGARPIGLRVLGEYDEDVVSYVGMPVWGSGPDRHAA